MAEWLFEPILMCVGLTVSLFLQEVDSQVTALNEGGLVRQYNWSSQFILECCTSWSLKAEDELPNNISQQWK